MAGVGTGADLNGEQSMKYARISKTAALKEACCQNPEQP